MQIVHDRDHLAAAMEELAGFGSLGKEGGLSAERPVLIDRFLAAATEVDVDAIRDHTGEVLIGGVMEHVEEAGVHSGDSACAIPPQTLPSWVVEVIEAYAAAIAKRLDVQAIPLAGAPRQPGATIDPQLGKEERKHRRRGNAIGVKVGIDPEGLPLFDGLNEDFYCPRHSGDGEWIGKV